LKEIIQVNIIINVDPKTRDFSILELIVKLMDHLFPDQYEIKTKKKNIKSD